MIKTLIVGTTLAMAMLFGTVGCGGGGKTCADLNKKICEGKDDAYCKKTAAWLDSNMTGPDGKKLTKSQAKAGCQAILGDKRSLESYIKTAARKVK